MTRVRRVLAPNPGTFTLEGTNTWIVGDGPSIVIDPGPDDPGHLLEVSDQAEPIGAILLTHRHPDHALGAARLAEATAAPVYAFRPEGEEGAIRHNQVLEVGAVTIRAVHTPGHTSDHLVFLLEEELALFTGDAVLGRGTSVVDPPDGDMSAYLHSLAEMRALEPRTIYPGHGPAVFDAIGKLDEYARHRMQREAQVVEALANGKGTAEEIVPGIYGGEVADEVLPIAARSVLAHLVKLEREGRVARSGAADHFVLVEQKPCARCGRRAAPRSRYCRQCSMDMLQEGPAKREEGSAPAAG